MDIATQIARFHQDAREVILLEKQGQLLSKPRLRVLLEDWQERLVTLEQADLSPRLRQDVAEAQQQLTALARQASTLMTARFQDELLSVVHMLHQ